MFALGLLHGLGFAGVLSELGLPPGRFAPALLGFNIGVELGQLAVIAMALLLVGWWRDHERYRQRVAIPVSVVIALLGLWLALDRLLPT